MMVFWIYLVVGAIAGALSAVTAPRMARSPIEAFFLGLFLWPIALIMTLKQLMKPTLTSGGDQSKPKNVLPQKKVITITDLPDYDASIKAMIVTRLKRVGYHENEALALVMDISPIQCLGVPEATILNVILQYAQLVIRTSSYDALKFIDEVRADGTRVQFHQNTAIIEYLRVRVYQELYNNASPSLSHPDWECDEETFHILYSLALSFFDDFVNSPESDEFL